MGDKESGKTWFAKAMEMVPKTLCANGAEYVSWEAFTVEAGSPPRPATSSRHSSPYTLCYSPIMGRLANLEIRCRPFDRGSSSASIYNRAAVDEKPGHLTGRLSPEQYLLLIGLFREAGAIPPEVEVYSDEEGGNLLTVPHLGWDRHTVYIVLSLYRWMDCYPNHMWSMVVLSRLLEEEGVKLPFLQVAYYTLHCWKPYAIHSFLPDYLPLSVGWAWARFNRMSPQERAKFIQAIKGFTPSSDFTHTLLSELSRQILPDPEPLRRIRNHAPEANEISGEELLHPRFSVLFTHPDQIGPKEYLQLLL